MHWTYEENLDNEQLYQGDVLSRTHGLNELLKEVHPWFFDKPENKHFMVLTQTCDLVRRPKPSAEYIAICPIRPLSGIINRQVGTSVSLSNAGIPVGTQRSQNRLRDFLARLFNNNESGLFYLEKDQVFPEDCCALTRLSISIKAEHYDRCLSAKALQLAEPFQAKLGWAVGNIYSRVGTRDWRPDELSRKVDLALGKAIVWVSNDRQRDMLVAKIDEVAAGGALDDRAVRKLQQEIGNKKKDVVGLVERLMSDIGIDELARARVSKRLISDPELAKLLPT